MNPRWPLYSTAIAAGGVVAGVLAFAGARLFFTGQLGPLAAGLVTVIAVDVTLVVWLLPRLTAGRRDDAGKD